MRRSFLCSIVLSSAFLGISCGDGGGGGVEVPGSVTITQGNGQTGQVGTALAQALQVRVTSDDGKALSGVPVTWSVASGGGSVSPGSAQTEADGTASASWTLGTSTGQQEAKATVQGLTAASFTATATAGAAATLTLSKTTLTFDGIGQTDALGPVEVKDAHENIISGATVTFESGDENVATVNGSGTVTSTGAGETTITATSGAASATASVTVTIQPFEPQSDTTLSGTVNVPEMTLPEGVTITLEGATTLNVTGEAIVTGTVEGDCQALTLTGGSVTVSGTINNSCSTEDPEAPGLTITSAGALELDGAEIVSDGDITISNTGGASAASRLRDAGFKPMVGLPFRAEEGGIDCVLRNADLIAGYVTQTVRLLPGDGWPGASVNYRCAGDLSVYSSTVRAQWGGDGFGQVLDGEGSYDSGGGGAGGDGGSIFFEGNTITIGAGPNSFYPGGGGAGGNWYANGEDPEARGGAGGWGGRLAFNAPVTATVESLDLYLAQGGDGGWAEVQGLEGTTASAWGGDGGSLGDPDNPQVFGGGIWSFPGGVTVHGASTGKGGNATVAAPDGSTGTYDSPAGGDGGTAAAWGGDGGGVYLGDDVLVNDPSWLFLGRGGTVRYSGGNGGTGYGSCAIDRPDNTAGTGGSGGTVLGGPGAGGMLGTLSGTRGSAIFDGFGNGGVGGRSGSPAPGGSPAENPLIAETFLKIMGASFETGNNGRDCATDMTMLWTVLWDPSGHDPFTRYSSVVTVTMDINPGQTPGGWPAIVLEGNEPWVDVTGSVSTDPGSFGVFTATGYGTVAGYPNVQVNVYSGTVTMDQNRWPTGMTGLVDLGPNGELPGGNRETLEGTGTAPNPSPPASAAKKDGPSKNRRPGGDDLGRPLPANPPWVPVRRDRPGENRRSGRR